jgi:hypothetical protein
MHRRPVDIWHFHVILRHRIFYGILLLILLWFYYFIWFPNRYKTFPRNTNFLLSSQHANYPQYFASGQMNVQCHLGVLQIWMWISIFERRKMFIISLLVWLPVCPMYFLPHFGQKAWKIQNMLNLPISPIFCMPKFSLCY